MKNKVIKTIVISSLFKRTFLLILKFSIRSVLELCVSIAYFFNPKMNKVETPNFINAVLSPSIRYENNIGLLIIMIIGVRVNLVKDFSEPKFFIAINNVVMEGIKNIE